MPWGRSSAGVMFCNEPEVLSLRLSVFNYCKVEGWPWLEVGINTPLFKWIAPY